LPRRRKLTDQHQMPGFAWMRLIAYMMEDNYARKRLSSKPPATPAEPYSQRIAACCKGSGLAMP